MLINDTILPEKFEITTSDLTYEKVKLKGLTEIMLERVQLHG